MNEKKEKSNNKKKKKKEYECNFILNKVNTILVIFQSSPNFIPYPQAALFFVPFDFQYYLFDCDY